jgi:hypothetical protein
MLDFSEHCFPLPHDLRLRADILTRHGHPKKVKPPKLFAPTVRAVKEIVPNKLIPKLKPTPPRTSSL